MAKQIEYYCPVAGINARELYDVVKNWVNPDEWKREGFTLTSDNGKGFCSYQFAYKEEIVDILFSSSDEHSPISILNNISRNRERVASKLVRILKVGDIKKVDESRFV